MAECNHAPGDWSPGCKHDPTLASRRSGVRASMGYGFGYVVPYAVGGSPQFAGNGPSEGGEPEGDAGDGGGEGGGGGEQ